jgi:hypothetical protein
VTTGGSGYADVPLNAKLAFNPNTNQLIIVPTGLLPNNTVYLFALSGITASNGDKLTVPGGGSTFYASFLLQTSGATASTPSTTSGAPGLAAPPPPIINPNPTGLPAVMRASASRSSARSGRTAAAVDHVLAGRVAWAPTPRRRIAGLLRPEGA